MGHVRPAGGDPAGPCCLLHHEDCSGLATAKNVAQLRQETLCRGIRILPLFCWHSRPTQEATQAQDAWQQALLAGEGPVLFAMQGEPSSHTNKVSDYAGRPPERRHKTSSMRSRMSEPVIPGFTTVRQAMISREWALMMQAPRTMSPVQQIQSNPPEQ